MRDIKKAELKTVKAVLNHSKSTTKVEKSRLHRDCNLCDLPFKAGTQYERFCADCKENEEVYQFADWLQAA